MAPSDPLHIAEDENEQGPEENGDDSSPDENYNLHVGPVTWSLSERKKGRKSVLDAKGLKTHTHTHTAENYSALSHGLVFYQL